METSNYFVPCSKCPLRRTDELNLPVLEDFIYDSLLMSMNHFYIIEQILSREQREKYYLKHAQAELLLSILRRLKMSG